MRTLLILALLLTTPGSTDSSRVTETIPLHHYPALEFSRFLEALTTSSATAEVRFGLEPRSETKIPKGLVAWSAHPTKNDLTVTGSAKSIQELKDKLIPRFDFPMHVLPLRSRVLHLDSDSFDALWPGMKKRRGGIWLINSSGREYEALRAKSTLLEYKGEVWSNLPLHLRWRDSKRDVFGSATIVQRVDGDGKIKLFTIMETVGSIPNGGLFRQLEEVRQIRAGEALVIVPYAPGPALVIDAPARETQ